MIKGTAVHHFYRDQIDTPIGECLIVSDGSALRALDFLDYESRMLGLLKRYYGNVELCPRSNPGGASEALARYFDGELNAIDELEVGMAGTDFQRRVWRGLRRMRAGQTLSYGDLARTIGKPRAVRAVGHANGANPIAVVVPCHRIVGSNGQLTGYGGGLHRKAWLLDHEARATTP